MTTTLFMNGRSQAVRLPKEFRLSGEKVSIRRVGNGILLEPVGEESWPEGYFESIRIVDEAFARPDQGELPPVPSFGE
jgi:antitoxin VapB